MNDPISTLNEYQNQAEKTAIFPINKALEYLALGLCGEAGEYANKVKKFLRGDYRNSSPEEINELHADLASELGDVLWYLALSANTLGYTLQEIAHKNLTKLADRNSRAAIIGSGDKR